MKELITKSFLKDILFIFIVLLLIVNIIDILYPDFKNKLFKKPIENFKNKKNNKDKIVKFWDNVVKK